MGRPKTQTRKNGLGSNGKEEVVNPQKLKRKLREFIYRVCGKEGHNKQTCEVAKRQRMEEF